MTNTQEIQAIITEAVAAVATIPTNSKGDINGNKVNGLERSVQSKLHKIVGQPQTHAEQMAIYDLMAPIYNAVHNRRCDLNPQWGWEKV